MATQADPQIDSDQFSLPRIRRRRFRAAGCRSRQFALLAQGSGKRLEAETDSRCHALGGGGLLDDTMYGPGTLDEKMRRRSIYFFVKRSQLVPMMTLFDAPDSLQDIALRSTTTVAPQALLMMNSPLVRTYAEGFAAGSRQFRRERGGQRAPGLCDCGRPRADGRGRGRRFDISDRAGAVVSCRRQT